MLLKKLVKKYASLKTYLQGLIRTLEKEPDSGIHLGHGIHKIRLAIKFKAKGKSGGARVITYLVTQDHEVCLVYIYDKSQLENVTKEQILELLKKVGLND